MKRKLMTRYIPAMLASLLLACGVVAETKIIQIDGSSTVFPITEAIAEEFQAASGGTRVTVGISGTGGGFKKFVRGETDISNASRPILAKEMEEAKKNGITYLEIPIAFDALTVTVNPKNTWVDQLTIAELKTMWAPESQNTVTNWNQIRPGFPDKKLTLYGAGSDSGTFDYFTEAVNGKSKSSRGDFTASEDDNVLVQGIANDEEALGYFGYAYYAENAEQLKAVPVVNAEGKAVLPSSETVKDGSYNPLARPIFIYVNVKALDRPEVKSFVEFFLKNAPTLVEEVKYIPLPDEAYTKGLERVEQKNAGTAFGGEAQIGLHIDELLARPLVQ